MQEAKTEERNLRKEIFIFVLFLKIIFSFLVASHYLKDLFTPFINWFVLSGFKNPWEYFYSIDKLKMFPYPTVMLWIMTIPRILFSPFLSNDWQIVSNLHLFVMRLPLLLFDLFLYRTFLKIFPTKKDLVLFVYWCSPIIFFINYIHGQLDIIPTAIFFYAISQLINKKYFRSIIFCALATATKSHILIFMPFIILFLYKQRIKVSTLALYMLSYFALYFLLISPYIFSEPFIQMVFRAEEQKRVYEFTVPISESLRIVVCPVMIFLLFMKFSSYKKLNNEILLMFSGIAFACFVIFVTPMPGWFIWSLPFLIYFYINNLEFSRAPFVIYNLVYILYFTLFFEKNYYSCMGKLTDICLVNNIALSIILSSIGFTAVWMFQVGIRRNEELKIKEKPLLIGIGGDSSTGKHSLYELLKKLLGENFCVPVFGDNFHKWERGNENWKEYTHLNPYGNKLHQGIDVAVSLKEGNMVELSEYDHKTGKFTDPKAVESNKYVFFVGLHPFYLKRMRDLIDIKIFMNTDEQLRQFWKIQRDVAKRGYDKSKVIEQISSRADDRDKFILPQKSFADLVVNYCPLEEINLNEIDKDSEIKIKVKYILENSIDLDKLVHLLENVKSLLVYHNHMEDLTHQELHISGEIGENEVSNIFQELGLNADELLFQEPVWSDNYNGITQLIFMIIYNQKMKVK